MLMDANRRRIEVEEKEKEGLERRERGNRKRWAHRSNTVTLTFIELQLSYQCNSQYK